MIVRALILCLLAMPVWAEEVVLGLSQDKVAITATFDGSDILLFGAIKREAPVPDGDLGLVITVSGPTRPVMVHRKERRMGIWVNTVGVKVDAAPVFYAVATSGPLDAVLSSVEDLRHQVTIPRAIRAVGTGVADTDQYIDALIRVRLDQALYQRLIGAVAVDEDTLFRTRIALPANLTEGAYAARIFLTRDGAVIDTYETVIPVQKVGVERWLYELARDQALVYGIMSLAIAAAAGWGASAAFQRMRG